MSFLFVAWIAVNSLKKTQPLEAVFPEWGEVAVLLGFTTMGVGLAITLMMILYELFRPIEASIRARISRVATVLLLLPSAFIVLSSFGVLIFGIVTWIRGAPPIIAGVGILLSGCAAFTVRYFRRSTYGVVEVITGIIVGTSKLTVGHSFPLFGDDWMNLDMALGVLCAGIYLVVRGLDNIHTGIVKEPYDPWARRIAAILFDEESPVEPEKKNRSAETYPPAS